MSQIGYPGPWGKDAAGRLDVFPRTAAATAALQPGGRGLRLLDRQVAIAEQRRDQNAHGVTVDSHTRRVFYRRIER
jgi:hypothetical protein